ncbi:MAG: peptidase MA family metallohydrolase [Desulfobacteraceae bacterium]
MPKRIAIVFSVFLFVIFHGSLHGAQRGTLQDKGVLILFDEPLRVAAEEAVTLYPRLKKELEERLARPVNFRTTIVLVKESETFKRMAGTGLIVAFAIPEKNLMVIDYSKTRIDPFSIETTMKHELCHLLLHNHIKEGNLPKWLDEGICQWVSDGISEIIMTQKKSVLDEAILSGRHISIRALTGRFPRDERYLVLAYEESKSLVEYIISAFGEEALLSMLNDLTEGVEVDAAILRSLSISLDELESRWHQQLKREITWVTYLINHLYEILFFLAAMAMIYGFIRGLMKKRAYRDEEEEEGE